MGEARRRRESGEMKYWFHGTNEYFVEWGQPPVRSRYKPELVVHPFVCLTKNKPLALGASEETGGLARAFLLDAARVIDYRQSTTETKTIWNELRATETGSRHPGMGSHDAWLQACKTGIALRPAMTSLEQMQDMEVFHGRTDSSPSEKIAAALRLQNATREWINAVISPAQRLGYDAVICAETDKRNGGTACVNLHVFNANVLSAPEWLVRPNEDDIRAADEWADAAFPEIARGGTA